METKEKMKLIFPDGEEINFIGIFGQKENKNMSCTGDKPCNCQNDTPYTPYDPNVVFPYTGSASTWKIIESGFENEKPGEKIKRRVNDFQEQVKIMLNNLIDELGINFGEIEVNLNDEGNKIESVYVFWDVEK